MSQSRTILMADIHGNAVALRAVLRDIDRRGADRLVCLGDVATLGPAPSECLASIAARCEVAVRGNHDRYLLESPGADPHLAAPVVRHAVDACRAGLGDAELATLRSWPLTQSIELPGGRRLFAYHGSPRSDIEDVLAGSDDRRVDEQLAGATADLYAGGHTHLQMLRQHRGRWVVNAGSVGMPFREVPVGGPPVLMPWAEYAAVCTDGPRLWVELHRVELSAGALRDAVAAWDHPFARELARQYETWAAS